MLHIPFFVCDVNSCNQLGKGTYHLHVVFILNVDLSKLCHSSFYVSLFNAHKGQFYRIHVGIQSPEGFSSSHGILRRFSDFLKLCSDVSWGNCWHVNSNIPSVANLLFQISSILNLRCFLPVTQNQLILSEYTITTYRK